MSNIERKIEVDGTEVKVKAPASRRARPAYNCKECGISFPSELDLEQHRKVDHLKKVAAA